MDACSIAVVGATGAVGRVFLDILEERNFPAKDIRLCASKRSVGKKLKVKGQEIAVEEATPELFSQVDVVFISASGDVSRALAPVAVQQGAFVIDDSSVFRMETDVALVVPEVNASDLESHLLKGHRAIVSIPNCPTTPLVLVLKPPMDVNPVVRVTVDTYPSVSGTCVSPLPALPTHSAADLAADWSPDGLQIVFVRRRDGNSEIFIMNADGTGQVNLTNRPLTKDFEPSWNR